MEKINEKLINDNPIIIPFDCTKKILEQMKKCICKITIDKEKGTGFFCKIPFPDKNNMIPVFITNNHVINKLDEKIVIYIEEECEERKILINNDRMIYMSNDKKYDITIVEIKEEDNIKNYLELDDNIIEDILKNEINIKNAKYIDNKVYAIQYPDGNLSVSYGLIQAIFEERKYEFQHKCSTMFGSSGSPILNLKSNKLIGIHKHWATNFNIATFLNEPINEFIKNNIKNKIDNNYNCHFNEIESKKINNETKLKRYSSIKEEDIPNKIRGKNRYNSLKHSSTNNSLVSNFKNNTPDKYNIKTVNLTRKLSKLQQDDTSSTNKKKEEKIPLQIKYTLNNIETKKVQKNQSDDVFLTNAYAIPNKKKRFDKDKKIKFNLNMVNIDYLTHLRRQCKNLFTENFSEKIFNNDFDKQLEALKKMNAQINKNKNIFIYLDNLDLILKIFGIRLSNNLDIKITKNLFEFLDSLFTVLFENKYKLNETESNIIISILIDKLSLNNNTLREHCLSLLNKYIEFLETNKIMVTVINIALSKNNKIKTDILDLAIDLVSKDKLNISTKVYAKLFCKFLPFYENVIRSKTLSLFQEIYNNIGEELWNMIEISDKDREFLEQNLCDERDGDEDEEKEGEEEEDDEMENDDINNEINNSEGGDKNEILSNGKNENNNGNVNTDENKQTNKDSEKMKIFENKNGKMTKEDLDIILDNLLKDDPNEKLNTIILIHENICGKFEQNKEVLIPNVDKIITTFKSVSHKLFYMTDLNTIPIKFAKYLSIVFCKLASNKELISNLSYNILLDISRELLRYLLINGLDRIGDKQEGNIIFKSINSTVLRILENCDITFVISALLELIKEFYEKDDKNLVNLSIKCLLKSAYNLSQNIDNIKISQILLQIHLLLLSLQKKNKDLNKKSQTDALIINTVKNIIGEFVKYKKEKILEEYSKSVKNHQFNDKFLLKWIKAELEKS